MLFTFLSLCYCTNTHTHKHQKIKIITKMVHIRFASLVLGLLFVTHALREFYTHAHQGWEMKGNGFEVTREEFLSTNYHKELPNIIGMDSNYMRKLGPGGRKMVGHHLPSRKEIKKDELEEEAASKKITTISGKDNKSEEKFPGASEHELLNINQNHKLEANTLKSATFEDPKSKTSFKASFDDHESSSKGETQRLLDETEEELVTLMHRDYNQPNNAHGKPPINNGLPKHESSNIV